MFGDYIKQNTETIQKRVWSKDYKHEYLVTKLVLLGKVIATSKIEIKR